MDEEQINRTNLALDELCPVLENFVWCTGAGSEYNGEIYIWVDPGMPLDRAKIEASIPDNKNEIKIVLRHCERAAAL